MANNRYRWRTNPTVIARYVMGHDVPAGMEVTLKPNEACVVLEDGRVAGIATQQHMEVNPKIGILGKLFGKTAPNRAFLFALLGPHDLEFELNLTSPEGERIRGMYSMRVNYTRETIAKVLHLPARGAMEITAGTLIEQLQAEVESLAVRQFSGQNAADLRKGSELSYDLDRLSGLLRSSLDHQGLRLQSSYITWDESKADEILRMRKDLEHRVAMRDILDEQAQDDMQRLLNAKVHEATLQSGIRATQELADIETHGKIEIKKVATTGDIEKERVKVGLEIGEITAKGRQKSELSEAEHMIELEKLRVERERISKEAALKESRAREEQEAQKMKTKVEQAMALKTMMGEMKESRLEKESQRLQSMVNALQEIAMSTDSAEVRMEALRQIAELNKSSPQD